MQAQRTLKTVAISFVALFLFAAIVPTASAQNPTETTPQFFLEKPSVSYTLPSGSSALKPEVGQAEVTVPWTYSITDPGFTNVGTVYPSTTVQFSDPSCNSPFVIVTGSTVDIINLAGSGGQASSEDSGEVKFDVVATQQAPGETPVSCTFKAKANQLGSQVKQSDESSTTATVQIAYLGLISANVQGTIKEAAPQKKVTYDIEISNLGNARSFIQFNLLSETPKGWEPVTPTEIVLQSEAQGGTDTSKVVGFTVSMPFKNGWNNDDTTFQLQLTPTSTQDTEVQGQSLTINVLARVRGVYIPSLEPMMLVGAVIGTALVARMLRSEE